MNEFIGGEIGYREIKAIGNRGNLDGSVYLNSHFEKIVAESDFRFDKFELLPIKNLCPVTNHLTKEFTTSVVHCHFVLKEK